jgi:hypothetical protein
MNAWDKQTIYKPTEDVFGWDFDATWLWRVNRTNMGTIFISELVPHIPSSEQQFWH